MQIIWKYCAVMKRSWIYLVICEAEEFFSETIVLLLRPLVAQELDDFVVTCHEDVAVSPDRIGGVCILDLFWVPRILLVLCFYQRGMAPHFVFHRS